MNYSYIQDPKESSEGQMSILPTLSSLLLRDDDDGKVRTRFAPFTS